MRQARSEMQSALTIIGLRETCRQKRDGSKQVRKMEQRSDSTEAVGGVRIDHSVRNEIQRIYSRTEDPELNDSFYRNRQHPNNGRMVRERNNSNKESILQDRAEETRQLLRRRKQNGLTGRLRPGQPAGCKRNATAH